MIVKELDPFHSDDPMLKAGRAAEEQMAFYLRRAFQDDSSVLVFNSLRLERDGDAAQIDHFILHQGGAVIIESKSVSGRVEINIHDEWTRWFGRSPKGMPSPILQARRQGEFLQKYLQQYSLSLRSKTFGVFQRTFERMPIGILVSISDGGIINRPKKVSVSEVCKADQVVDRTRAIIGDHQTQVGFILRREEFDRVSNFLLQHHRPLNTGSVPRPSSSYVKETPEFAYAASPEPVPAAASAVVVAPPAPTGPFSCRSCGRDHNRVEWGKFGYYLKCPDCQGNTPLNLSCSRCGGKEKTRKNGSQFFRECQTCQTSDLYYINPG